jgi:hypothetical protein
LIRQITDQQFSALKKLIRAGHVLLGKIGTTIEEEELNAIEEFQNELREAEVAINEVAHAGS